MIFSNNNNQQQHTTNIKYSIVLDTTLRWAQIISPDTFVEKKNDLNCGKTLNNSVRIRKKHKYVKHIRQTHTTSPYRQPVNITTWLQTCLRTVAFLKVRMSKTHASAMFSRTTCRLGDGQSCLRNCVSLFLILLAVGKE